MEWKQPLSFIANAASFHAAFQFFFLTLCYVTDKLAEHALKHQQSRSFASVRQNIKI
jgi:hypothetical protein